jgi:pimeloyl-ACP methyl ester carboxylesterase
LSRQPMPDVVVMLPGITGSVLQKDGKDVWAISAGTAFRALVNLGRSLTDLKLTGDDPEAADLGDGVRATRVMPDVHLIPGLWKIDGYGKVTQSIKRGFEVEEGANYFEFPYDWRRDNRAAARQLAHQSHSWLKAWQERSGNREAKLILVAHSMGGLVSRFFLECLDGWKVTRMLVTFGTPFGGSLNALGFIANGMRKDLGPLTLIDLSDLLRSFTSVYQLLPIYDCVDTGGENLLKVTDSGAIPNLDPTRAEEAMRFHLAIRKAVDAHNQEDDYRRQRYRIRPIVGMFQPTLQSARVREGKVELLATYRGRDEGGDGTVPRVSATPLELEKDTGAMYASQRHASLQNFNAVLDQLAAVFMEGRIGLDRYYRVNTKLSLEIDDAYGVDEPVEVRVRPEAPGVDLTAVVVDADRNTEVIRRDLIVGDDGIYRGIIGHLAPGVYRLTVTGPFAVDPVTDLFAVFGPPEE